MLTEELRKLTAFDAETARKEAQDVAQSLKDEPPLNSGKNGDYISPEEQTRLTMSKDIPGNVPDFRRTQTTATEEDIEAARNWAQTLSDE